MLWGAHLGDQGFPATSAGYCALCQWASSHGAIQAVGIEGTGSCGARLAWSAPAAGISALEVDGPYWASRRRNGKSDPLEAYVAAAASGRTQCINQVHAELVSDPEGLREAFRQFSGEVLIRHLARLRLSKELSDPATAARFTLCCLARRHQMLTAEITVLIAALQELTTQAAPGFLVRPGFGPDTTAQLLITAGGQPGAPAFGSCVRPPVRGVSDPGVFRAHRPAPAQPRR